MKRILIFLLTIFFILSLTACSEKVAEQPTIDEEDYWNAEEYPEYDANAKYSLDIEYEFAKMHKFVQNGKNFVVFAAKVLSENHSLNSILAYNNNGEKLNDEYEVKQFSGYYCLTDEYHKTGNNLSHSNDHPMRIIMISSTKDIDFDDFQFKFKVSHTEDKERTVDAKLNSEKNKMVSDKCYVHGASFFSIGKYDFLMGGTLGANGNISTHTYYNAIRILPLFDNVDEFNIDERIKISAVNYDDGSDYKIPDGYELYFEISSNNVGTYIFFGLKDTNGTMSEDMIKVCNKLCPKFTFENGDSVILLNAT